MGEKQLMSKRFSAPAGLLLLCALLLGMLLSACSDTAADEPQETRRTEYRVRYYDGKTLLRELRVPEGETAAAFMPELEGRRFLSWQTQKGESVQPERLPVTKNVNYYTWTLPLFGTHEPYLFADGEGWIRAEAPLSANDFAAAVAALAPGGNSFGKLPSGAEPLDASALREVLLRFYTDEELSAFPAEGTLSRAAFARAMNALLSRGGEECVLPAKDVRAPADLSPGDEGYADVLEACLVHTADESGAPWTEIELSTGLTPGLVYADGLLRCVGADGRYIRNAVDNTLYYDENGLYSSGDRELDALVSELLRSLGKEFPKDAADRMAMLRHVYDYFIATYRFVGRNAHTDDPGWEARDGKLMLETGRGDCYNYAGAFTMLARALGYPAFGVIHSLDEPDNLHAWTDIVIDGKAYLFDPQLAQRFSNDRFALSYDEARPAYGYVRPLGFGQYSRDSYDELVWDTPTECGKIISLKLPDGGSALVYLPYGYDAAAQYDLLLCLNSGEGDFRALLGTDSQYAHRNRVLHRQVTTPSYLDYLIQRGDCAPLIVVSVSTADDKTGEKTPERALAALQKVAERYSTYAETADKESICAARAHFALAGTERADICLSAVVRELPGCFGSYLICSALDAEGKSRDALSGSREVDTLLMAYGTLDRKGRDIKALYQTLSEQENVAEAQLLAVKGSSANDWTVFDNALRELLMRFSPGQGQ